MCIFLQPIRDFGKDFKWIWLHNIYRWRRGQISSRKFSASSTLTRRQETWNKNKMKSPHFNRSQSSVRFWLLDLFGKVSFVNLSAEGETDKNAQNLRRTHTSCNFILLQHGWLPIWHHIILDGPTHTTMSSFINLSLTNITLYCNRRIHKLQCHPSPTYLKPISHYSGPTWRRTSSMRAVSALVESLFNKFPRRGRHPCVSSRSASTSTPWSLISASFSSASTSLRRVCSTSYLNI